MVQPNGTLRFDNVNIPIWYNHQLDFIRLFTTFVPPRMQKKINRMEMMRAYCFAFLAYHKVCSMIGRLISPNYNPGLIIDDTHE